LKNFDGRTEIDHVQDLALEALTDAPNYQNWLASMAEPFLGTNPLEIGGGNGNYADIWLKHGFQKLTLNEADDRRLALLHEKFAPNDGIKILDVKDLALASKQYSSCSSFNVLEHVKDDRELIKSMSTWVKDGGYVFILVPAFPFAYSNFDKRIGHYRRYTKKSLALAMQSSGLKLVDVRYVNPLGLVAWFVMMKLFRGSPNSGIALDIWDKIFIPVTRRIEQYVRMPFGQSCIGVGIVEKDTST